MVRVMVPPNSTVVAGVNTSTGATVAPETWDAKLMDVKAAITAMAVMARASLPAVKVASVLDDILKPKVASARGVPRVSPVRVMVIAAVPDTAPAVVRTISVLVAVTAAEVAVKRLTLLAMEETVPKK